MSFETDIQVMCPIPGAIGIKLAYIFQEQAESKPKACPNHQRERWTNVSK